MNNQQRVMPEPESGLIVDVRKGKHVATLYRDSQTFVAIGPTPFAAVDAAFELSAHYQ